MCGNLLKSFERFPDSRDQVEFSEELRAEAVSNKTRQTVRQNFSDLIRFVFSRADCGLTRQNLLVALMLCIDTATPPITKTSFATTYLVRPTQSTSTCAASC